MLDYTLTLKSKENIRETVSTERAAAIAAWRVNPPAGVERTVPERAPAAGDVVEYEKRVYEVSVKGYEHRGLLVAEINLPPAPEYHEQLILGLVRERVDLDLAMFEQGVDDPWATDIDGAPYADAAQA